MFKNYFRTILRNLLNNKFYSLLNIFGLATGIVAAIFILLYVKDELSYDRYNKNYQRIYRLEGHFNIDNKDEKFSVTQVPLAPTLKDENPEIETYVRFNNAGTLYFKKGGYETEADSVYYADSTVFDVFTNEFVSGSPERALTRPNTMVVTQSFAKRFLDDGNPVGQTLTTVGGNLFEITGVIKDLPQNTHLKYTALISMSTLEKWVGKDKFNDRSENSFWNVEIFSYIMLKEGTDIQPILDRFPQFYDKYMKDIGEKIKASFKLMVKPLADIHLNSNDLKGELSTGNKWYVYVFMIIAVFILFIASINYMNLSTARAVTSAREVGVRKISGAPKLKLVTQFLSESVILSLMAFVFAIVLTFLLLPLFNDISGKHFSMHFFTSTGMILGMIGITLFVGLISGIYPAFFLASYKPVKVLKGNSSTSDGKGTLRKILVIFQFTLSVTMIIATMIVSGQLKFMRNAYLGFDKADVLVMTMRDSTLRKDIEPLKQELLKNPDILSVAASSSTPGFGFGIQVMSMEGENGEMVDRTLSNYFIDYNYIDLMKIPMVAGRNYQRNMPTDDKKAFIINETAARNFGWVDSTSAGNIDYSKALGKKFQYGIDGDGTVQRDGEIVGVYQDFHFTSLHNAIEPQVLLLQNKTRYLRLLNIRLAKNNRKETIDYIDKIRKEFSNKFPFEYVYLDENLNKSYSEEVKKGKLLNAFTILSIFIALLGLLGLSSYMTQQRSKEVGIRKVMGSSAGMIVGLFLKEFIKWVLIADVLACGIAYYFMDKWLHNFEYHMNIGIWIFLLSAAISVLIAALTVSFRVIQAAGKNPVDAIKYE